MKVLIVSFYYEPELGAAPSRIANLAKGLKASGVDVDILTCLPNYPKGEIFEGYRGRFSMKETIDGINVYRYWTYATVSKNPLKRVMAMTSYAATMWAFAFKRRLIKSYDRVIVQSPPIMVSASAVMMFKKLFGKNTILNVSDLWPGSAVELGFVREGSTSFKVLSCLERFIYRNASSVMGQSQEIVEYICGMFPGKRAFLYRNLQPVTGSSVVKRERNPRLKIVYAGLFGVAQDMLSLLKAIDFKSIDVEMHLYGGGNQMDDILSYIKDGDKNIYYHGYVSKQEINEELKKYDLSIIPLAAHIHGAVPSKIFDLLPAGIPILFSGDGEGARIVKDCGFGLVSKFGDYAALENNIRSFTAMSQSEYSVYVTNCLDAANGEFSFAKQMERFCDFIAE
ncbi:MAG: glycosyltransferase family 4 protein [Bacteroidaceae bacterium]|nr:glycosyltransferase family 4 protein [Bacteroidaceae bacterium]